MHVEIFMALGYLFMAAGAGLFVAGAIAYFALPARESDLKFVKLAYALSVVFVVLGVAGTLLHLGAPTKFFLALANFDSWLTRESWALGLFAGVGVIATILAFMRKPGEKGSAILTVFSILGVIMAFVVVFAMSMSYMVVPAIAAWSSLGVFFTNLAEAAALGAVFATLLAFVTHKDEVETRLPRTMLLASVIAIAAALVVFLLTQVSLGILPEGASVATSTTQTLALAKGIILLVAFGIALFSFLTLRKSAKAGLVGAAALIVLAVVGSNFISRALHFMVATHPDLR